MHNKRDLCRNFQRGSCHYGERCKYLHELQQQQKSNGPGFGVQNSSHRNQTSNPFGFGSHAGTQQHNTNPFGFGLQNSSQSTRGAGSESKQNQFKPFNNKWTRDTRPSSSPQNGASQKTDGNSQPVNHTCTDPETCKRQIAEDFEQEKPLWTLTCYGHSKGAPCDIVGDISYEELRALAYEDAKRGMPLQSIVERERNLRSSKLMEFQNLLREPYKMPPSSTLTSQQSQFLGTNANPFSGTIQNNDPHPLSVSSFSQLGASLNLGVQRPADTPVQPSSFGTIGNPLTSNMTNPFGGGTTGGQTQPSSFGTIGNPLTSNMTNPFGGGTTGGQTQPSSFGTIGNPLTSNMTNPFGGGTTGGQTQTNLFPTSAELAKFPNASTHQLYIASNGSSSSIILPANTDVQLSKPNKESFSGDVSIWLKDKWNPGEIPEEAPPDQFIR